MDLMELLLVDYQIKFFMHSQEHLHSVIVLQQINKNNRNFGKTCYKLIMKVQFYVVEQKLIKVVKKLV